METQIDVKPELEEVQTILPPQPSIFPHGTESLPVRRRRFGKAVPLRKKVLADTVPYQYILKNPEMANSINKPRNPNDAFNDHSFGPEMKYVDYRWQSQEHTTSKSNDSPHNLSSPYYIFRKPIPRFAA